MKLTMKNMLVTSGTRGNQYGYVKFNVLESCSETYMFDVNRNYFYHLTMQLVALLPLAQYSQQP